MKYYKKVQTTQDKIINIVVAMIVYILGGFLMFAWLFM